MLAHLMDLLSERRLQLAHRWFSSLRAKDRQRRVAGFLAIVWWLPVLALAQGVGGELRISVRDPQGLPAKCSVQIVSEGAPVRDTVETDSSGTLIRRNLPFGLYVILVSHPGFAWYSRTVQISSRVPVEVHVELAIQPLKSEVEVSESRTLVDPESTGTAARIGMNMLDRRQISLPGRSVIDLVASQPGWVLESNATLHPRGSESQVQYIVDGIPLTENRSPASLPPMEADELQSIAVLTGDLPAEYGRKLGGVVEVTGKKQLQNGLHGDFAAFARSFATANAYGMVSYSVGKNTFSASGQEESTGRFLDPPVLENYTNHAITGGAHSQYERELTSRDRVGFSFHHRQAEFDVPNELLQNAAGQQQCRRATENLGTATYEHVVSENALADFRFMFRQASAALSSNQSSTPIIANQKRNTREAYGKATVSSQHGMQNLKAGVEIDYSPIEEQFSYRITNPSFFDPSTPIDFSFRGSNNGRYQAAFVEDALHIGHWSARAGIRYDRYDLLVRRAGLSPRVGIGWYLPRADLNVHASFDRVFDTPASENTLLSSSPATQRLNSQVISLPVQPSIGYYGEAGITKGLFGTLKVDVNWYRRSFKDYADDDLLLNTGVSFPIAFREGQIYGSEAKVEIPRWGRVSGFASYSYMVGFGYTPVTGGLFLGEDARTALMSFGRFPVSQDQRNTLNARGVVQLTRRIWGERAWSTGAVYRRRWLDLTLS